MARMSNDAIFLSYAKEDLEAVRRFKRRLLADGFRVWMDEHDLLPGQDWDVTIRSAISQSALVIVFLSRRSVSKTGYIQKEIRVALDLAQMRPEGELFIVPVRLDECRVPERLAQWQWLDLESPVAYRRLRATILANTHIRPTFSKPIGNTLLGRFDSAGDRLLFGVLLGSDTYIYGTLPEYGRVITQGHFAVFRPTIPNVFRELRGHVSRYEQFKEDKLRSAAPAGYAWRHPSCRVIKIGTPTPLTAFALSTRTHVTTVWAEYWRIALLFSDCREIYMQPKTGQIFVEQNRDLVFTVMPFRVPRFQRKIERWAGSGVRVLPPPDAAI
jgi:hypothetical protein